MKYNKNIFKFITIMLMLTIIPLIPLTVSKIRDDKLIDHFQVEKIKEDNKKIQTSKLTVAEKLELIEDYANKEKNIIITTQVQDMSDENVTSIRMIINEQLSILKNLGILIDFNDDYVCYNYMLKRYSNVEDPSKSVSLYQVCFVNEKGTFEVVIDADTHMIYRYHDYNEKYQDKSYDLIYIFATEYLGLSEEQIYRYLFAITGEEMNSISAFDYVDSY